MNRREFVKALAGIPLLGLLARAPKAKEGWNLTMPGDPEYVDASTGSTKYILFGYGPDDEVARQFSVAMAQEIDRETMNG